jgi:hypothetical protein
MGPDTVSQQSPRIPLTQTSLHGKLVSMNDPVREAEGRLQRYWNVDGLHEIAIAVLLALTALWTWASDLSELPRAWKGAFSSTFPLMLCGGIFIEGRVIKAIRRRLTYPRAGFVEFRKPTLTTRLRAGLLGAFVAAAIAASMWVSFVDLSRWAMALIGIGMGGMMWQIGARSSLPRFQTLAVLVPVLGIAITFSGWPFEIGIVVFFAAAAAALFVSGCVTLWRFLHA